MIKKTIKSDKRKGYVLFFVLVAAIIFVLIGVGQLSLGFNSRLLSHKNTFSMFASQAAQSGIIKTIRNMNNKLAEAKTWNNSFLTSLNVTDMAMPNMDASSSTQISVDNGKIIIQSTGISGGITKTYYAQTQIKSVFDYAIFTDKDITLYPNSLISGCNTNTGQTDLPIKMATNSVEEGGVITLNGAYVNGDVAVGVGGDPASVVSSKGTITGQLTSLDTVMYFPPVYPPALPAKGSIKGAKVLSAADSGKYDSISLGNSEVITVSGNVVIDVTGTVDMKNGSAIIVPNGSSLTLYVKGDIVSYEGADINATGKAADLTIFAYGPDTQTVELKAKNDFHGAVYAPKADVGIKAGGNIYGSFVSERFELKSKSSVIYDYALKDKDQTSSGNYFAITRWWEE